MERIFSFDDIAGTIWHSGVDPSFGVETTEVGNEDEDVFMKRSASEFAFQEFIKSSCLRPHPKDAVTIAFSDDEAERDDDFSDALVPDGPGANGAPSLEDRSKPSEPKHDDATPTGKPSAPKADDHLDSRPSKPKATPEKSSCKEPEIKAALNPLFSGLRSEMLPASAGRDEQYYKEKLDELCQQARKHRGGALSLTEDHPGSLQARGAAPGQLGPEGVTSRTSSGGLAPESQGIPNKPVTSGSSQDQTDDDEIDEEQNLEPGDKKRVKRMLSNRESARRSRRRKQAHLNELESQVAQLRVQNSTLSESLQTTTQKLKDASKDNLQLKTYVEMLKAKLIAVNTLHRQLTMNGSNLQSHSRSPLGGQEMPAVSRGFGWETALHNIQPPRLPSYLMNPHINPAALAEMKNQQHDMEQQSISLTVQQGMKMSRTPSMQRVGSTDHLKKKNRNAPPSTSWDGMNLVDLEGPSMIPQFTLSSDY